MMWLDGDILQVYWNGYHHVAAYLGNTLVWRENIRATQGINYISTEVPSANTTLCLGISSEAFSKIVQNSNSNAATSEAENSKSTLHADVQVYGDAFVRAARMLEGILPISLSLDLVTVISALARAASSKLDHRFVPISKSNAGTSVSTNADTNAAFTTNNSTAQRRPVVLQGGESLEQFSTDSSESTSVPKTLVRIDATEPSFIFNGHPITKEPTPIEINSPATAFQPTTDITLAPPVSALNKVVPILTCLSTTELYPDEDYDARASQYINGTLTTIYAEDWGNVIALGPYLFYKDSYLLEMYLPDTLAQLPPFFCVNLGGTGTFTVHFSPVMTAITATNTFQVMSPSSKKIVFDCTRYSQVPVGLNITSSSWSTVSKIIVPSELLTDWKNASGWKNIASKIISE